MIEAFTLGMRSRLSCLSSGLLALLCFSSALATELRVEVGLTRSAGSIYELTDEAVRRFARRAALLSRSRRDFLRAHGQADVPFSTPVRVVLTENGVPLPMRPAGRAAGADIVPTFDTTGARAFPASYQTLLEDVFTAARPAMNAVFGAPAIGATVHVRNYDADIQDRLAVAGGYYIPNGPDGPEIRFPVYLSPVSAAINYVHTLLIAYQGNTPYPFDAINEGLVRAATMRVVRTPNSLPGSPDPAAVEQTLDSSYDVSTFYDWYNQPALGCRTFIAPNLLDTQLPAGGNTGGIFLLRYQMAGTAWLKVLTEHPAFVAEFNRNYYLNPAAYVTMDDFATLGQSVLAILTRSTVEGLNFADWMERQYILDSDLTAGLKLLVQPFPVDPTPSTNDFGVFGIVFNAFRTDALGNESLLAGTAFPVYWRPDFFRFFTTAQDDVIGISGAFGSVVPNFPGSTFGGVPYKVAVDVPFAGGVTRAYLPAGAVATATNPAPSNFYGTLTGLPPLAAGDYEVSVEWAGGSELMIPVSNFAFGVDVADAGFDAALVTTIRVFTFDGVDRTELFSRRLNKGPGPLALDLRPPVADASYTFTLPGRLSLVGVPLQPYRIRPSGVFGMSDDAALVARWNPVTSRFDLFPDEGQVMHGHGYYVRPAASASVTVNGVVPPRTPVSVSLQPGWNIVSVPFSQTIGTSNIQFTVATEAVTDYAGASGTIIGNTVFEFVPDGVNLDAGTLVPATSFEPGKGYLVRALRPEGAVMVFTPNDFSPSSPRGRGGRGGRVGVGAPEVAKGLPERGGGWNFQKHRWETGLQLTGYSGAKSVVVLGQRTEALKGYDPLYDSDLPPSPGGFQLIVIDGGRMFRDIRTWGARETYRLAATGLSSGERCTLRLRPTVGKKTLTLVDLESGTTRTFRGGGIYIFNAVGTTHRFEVRTWSAR